jgi:hypothetical protein
MKAKEKFETMYNTLPDRSKTELVVDFSEHPKTLRVVALEVEHNTNLGKAMLEQLGYEDDEI